MALPIKRYVSTPVLVDAVQVTEENMSEVAAWCGGTVTFDEKDPEKTPFIKVKVLRYLNEKQTRGFVGDYILKRGANSFKVYNEKAFLNGFTDDRDSIPMARATEMPALIHDAIVEAFQNPKVTKVVMGNHEATIVTPARGVTANPAFVEGVAE